jgi:hypothetical protein
VAARPAHHRYRPYLSSGARRSRWTGWSTPPGLIGLAGRQHPVGSQFAGRRVTVRLDQALMQITDQGVLLRSLPNPLSPTETGRIRAARPAGPAPAPQADPLRVDRRVSSRGALVIAGQKIHVGTRHAGVTLTVEAADTTFRIYHGDQLVTEVTRTTTKPITRFKARKPEPPRHAARQPSDVGTRSRSARGRRRQVRRLQRQHSMEGEPGCHRDHFATLLIHGGAGAKMVQPTLGHSTRQSTVPARWSIRHSGHGWRRPRPG